MRLTAKKKKFWLFSFFLWGLEGEGGTIRIWTTRHPPGRGKGEMNMLAYTYIEKGKFELLEKPKPRLLEAGDAIVKVTLASICSSDLHIKHGSVPRAVPGITVGHEMVGIVEEVGAAVSAVKPGDRVTVNVETFCGECFFCRKGWVNNCTDPKGGWALGCRIDGGQAEYVRVPHANQGLNRIPDSVTDLQALLVGDVLATGYWAARIAEIGPEDTVLILGAGPTPTPGGWILCGGSIPLCSPPRRKGCGNLCWLTATTAEPMQCWRWPAAPTASAWPGNAPGPTPW